MGAFPIGKRGKEKVMEIKLEGDPLPSMVFMTNWKLSEIKEQYLKFNSISAGSNYRYISEETFTYIFYHSKIPNPETIFEELDYECKRKLDIFQIMAILIWTSFSNQFSKLRFAYSLFDMNKDNIVSYDELEIFFIATCKGLSKFLRVKCLPKKVLKEIATTLFYRYDLNKSHSLELEEVYSWMESDAEFLRFLSKYEPKVKIPEREATFKGLPEVDIYSFLDKPLYGTYTASGSESKAAIARILRNKKSKYTFYLQDKETLGSAKLLIQKLENITKKSKHPTLSLKIPAKILQRSAEYSPEIKSSPAKRYNFNTLPYSSSKTNLKPPSRLFLTNSMEGKTTELPELQPINVAKIGKRLFTLNKTVYQPLLKPKGTEVPKGELEKWKELYVLLNNGKGLDMRLYMDYLTTKPELKKLLDLYLLHRKVAPFADCMYFSCNNVIVDTIMEKMILQTHPKLSSAKRLFLLRFATSK